MPELTLDSDKVLLETVASAKVAAALISVARDLYVDSLGPESARKLFESVVEHFFKQENRVLH